MPESSTTERSCGQGHLPGRTEVAGGVLTGGAVQSRVVQEEQLLVGAEPHVELDLVDPDLLGQLVALQTVLGGVRHRAAVAHDQHLSHRASHSPTLCSYFSRTRSIAGSSSFSILVSTFSASSPAE